MVARRSSAQKGGLKTAAAAVAKSAASMVPPSSPDVLTAKFEAAGNNANRGLAAASRRTAVAKKAPANGSKLKQQVAAPSVSSELGEEFENSLQIETNPIDVKHSGGKKNAAANAIKKGRGKSAPSTNKENFDEMQQNSSSEDETDRHDAPSTGAPPAALGRSEPSSKAVHAKTATGHNVDTADGLHEEMTTLKKLYKELQERFDTLSRLRTTDAEQLLIEYKAKAETRFDASEKLIKALTAENETLKATVSSISVPAHSSSRKSTAERDFSMDVEASSSAKASSLDRIVDLYRDLCGLDIKSIGNAGNQWSCEINGRQGGYSFELGFDESTGKFHYEPINYSANAALANSMPSYLKEAIVFGPDQLQLFFWRAMNFLMSVKQQ